MCDSHMVDLLVLPAEILCSGIECVELTLYGETEMCSCPFGNL